VLTLEAPLANVYERATVTLRANVIQASHGKTVHDEVLGSSDGSAANQRFRLRQAPLTYLSAPDGSGLESELHVAVAGVTWHEAPFLYGHGREERVYTAHQDHAGRTTITFGDGKTGARLPSTREEVTATYRIGSGEVGNVAAGSLTQIMSGAPGIDAVTNPLPATGGVDPEPAQAIKENMAVSQRATQRIVSLSDYADFCRTFAGIGQAVARTLHTTHGPLLHITVADADGKPLAADSALYTNLLAAIAARRAAPVPRVQIDSYESLYFDVANTLLIARDHLPRVAAIEAEAREVLCRVYGLAGRTLARDVSAAEIISRLQRLAGVVAVEVDTLALHGASGAAAVLPAQPARWDAGAQIARPAQLLIVNPHDGGITIRWEVAP
jgi:predicted phage baseplate assembly protein